MMRYRLTIEYDGTPFIGWQSQKGGGAVQDVLAEAIQKFCGQEVTVFGAGRTDTGVHARGQMAHIDLVDGPAGKPWPADKVMAGMNFHLKPHPVAVVSAVTALPEFDARFSALARHYEYRIISRRAPLALDRDRAWFVPQKMNLEAMQQAAAHLIGKHDFTTFRSAQCQAASPVKTLSTLDVSQNGDLFTITAAAPSFLHHQVRSLSGVLKAVGTGKWTAEEAKAALEACDRAACAQVAPACGLTFMAVDYPAELLAAPKT